MKHLFILNPAAGKRDRTKELTQAIREACDARRLDYQIAVSREPGDCARIARRAAQTGADLRLYAVGGDGTLNEVVCGAAGFQNAAVTHFAAGSGNDFVKIFSDPGAFSDVNRLLDAEEAEFDLIRCNDRFSLNICSVGLDARIGLGMKKYKRLPFVTGSGAYLFSVAEQVLRGTSRHYVVEIGDEVIDSRQTMIAVCNGRFYGGGFNPVPEADPTDGLLDVLLVKRVSLLQVATIVEHYKHGEYAQYPELIRHVKTRRLRILCDTQTTANLDGEALEDTTFTLSLANETLRFFYPRGLTWEGSSPK